MWGRYWKSGQVLSIVTKAPNVRVDTHTVVATIGTELESDGETITIKKTGTTLLLVILIL